MRVLVVDFDRRVLRFITIALRSLGYDVLAAMTVEEALSLAKSQSPDAIVLDVLVPDSGGFEILRRLRAFSEVPVLAVSIDDSIEGDALRLGANDFVAKPFAPDDLRRRLVVMLNTPPDGLRSGGPPSPS